MTTFGESDKQMMLEVTVVFGNPTIPNRTWLTECSEGHMFPDMQALREVATDELGELLDDQVFYRVFTREHSG